MALQTTAPAPLLALIDRYDARVFEVGRRSARIRLAGASDEEFDVILEDQRATLTRTDGGRPDAVLQADPRTWAEIARDVRGGMDAYRRGRLHVRHDLHLGVGFLAATAGANGNGMRFRHVDTARGRISICEAGSGRPALLIHGLGATKVSFLPTLAALAPHHRAIAVDLPGFGDSDKPLLAGYDAAFFADAMVALLDALEIESADAVGNSMGGRIAIELGLTAPDRVRRLALLAPSLAWLKARPWAPFLKLVAPQLGLLQPAPRPIVERIVRAMVPGSETEWTAAGIDEFLRSYLTARGRAAFYAATRNIYLEQPHGPNGFWTRLPSLEAETLFIWGRKDPLVPIGFEHHVVEALPGAEQLELDCRHVPQLERPKETHAAIERFFAAPGQRRTAVRRGRGAAAA